MWDSLSAACSEHLLIAFHCSSYSGVQLLAKLEQPIGVGRYLLTTNHSHFGSGAAVREVELEQWSSHQPPWLRPIEELSQATKSHEWHCHTLYHIQHGQSCSYIQNIELITWIINIKLDNQYGLERCGLVWPVYAWIIWSIFTSLQLQSADIIYWGGPRHYHELTPHCRKNGMSQSSISGLTRSYTRV